MFDLTRPVVVAAAALGILSTVNPALSQQTSPGFNWPKPVVHAEPNWNVYNLGILGVRAVVPLDVQAKILQRKYTPEEHRNVQTAIDEMSKSRDTPTKRSKNFKPASHGGFYVVHSAFGYPQRNGFSAASFMSREQQIEDIIANGNRVIVVFRILGGVSGPMYGFKGVGQQINMRESLKYEFDNDGLLSAFEPWSAEDLAFYEQLGGKLEFTGDNGPIALPFLPVTGSEQEVQARLRAGNYSDEQRHNVNTMLAVVASPDGFEKSNGRYFAKTYRNTDASAYFTLDKVNAQASGFRSSSLKNLKRQVTDFIVDNNRVWVHVFTTGTHSGPLFGVPASGKTLTWNEEIYATFDQSGKIAETTRYPVQGELYQQLGGKFTFPYAQYWKCDGCPNNPGFATLDIPGESR